MAAFLKDILEPSQRDIFNQLTRAQRTMTFSINSLKDRALLSSNIGLPSHLIHSCHQWPAYTTHTSPIVKRLAERDELRTAKLIQVPRVISEKLYSTESFEEVILHEHNYGTQETEATIPSPAFSIMGTPSSPFWIWKDSPVRTGDLGVQTNSLPLGPTATSNVVIFPRRAPLPMKPDSIQHWETKTEQLQK